MPTKPDHLSFRPNLESLAERIQPTSVVVVNGTLFVHGSAAADQAVVTHEGSSYKVALNAGTWRVGDARVTSGRVVFYGYGGDDYFRNDAGLGGIAHELRVSAYGMDGGDTLIGGAAADYLESGAGLDTLQGRGGNDILDGGLGEDYLFGGTGGDQLFAGFDASYNYLNGETGNDTLHGGDGFDYMVGDAGNDLMFGNGGDDHMSGGSGNDVMHGNAGNDYMHGGSGFDMLFGKQGDDTLNGGGDDDVRDKLFGGVGRDTFQWEHFIDDDFGFEFNPPLQEIEDFQFGIDVAI